MCDAMYQDMYVYATIALQYDKCILLYTPHKIILPTKISQTNGT